MTAPSATELPTAQPNVPANSRHPGPRAVPSVSSVLILPPGPIVDRHRRPQERLQAARRPPAYPNQARIIAPVTPSHPSAVLTPSTCMNRWIRANAGWPGGLRWLHGEEVSNRHTSASIHSGRRRSTEGQGGYHQDRADYRAIAVLSAWAEGLSIVGHGSSESVSISLTPSTPLHFAQVRVRPFPSRERGPLTCWRACLWIIERL